MNRFKTSKIGLFAGLALFMFASVLLVGKHFSNWSQTDDTKDQQYLDDYKKQQEYLAQYAENKKKLDAEYLIAIQKELPDAANGVISAQYNVGLMNVLIGNMGEGGFWLAKAASGGSNLAVGQLNLMDFDARYFGRESRLGDNKVSVSDLDNYKNIARNLKLRRSPAAIFLWERLSGVTRSILERESYPEDLIRFCLARDINRIIDGSSLLEDHAFRDIGLVSIVSRSTEENSEGTSIVSVNRHLLDTLLMAANDENQESHFIAKNSQGGGPPEIDQKDSVKASGEDKHEMSAEQNLQFIASFAFGVIFAVTLIVISIYFPHPTAFQYTVFRVVLAVSASGIAAMIPGLLSIKLSAGSSAVITAAGALGVFIIVYFFSPVRLAINPADDLSQLQKHPAQPQGQAAQPQGQHAQSQWQPKQSKIDSESITIAAKPLGETFCFSIKDKQIYRSQTKWLAGDGFLYGFKMSDALLGSNGVKFYLEVYRSAVRQLDETTLSDSFALSIRSTVSMAPLLSMKLDKIERRRAYFTVINAKNEASQNENSSLN